MLHENAGMEQEFPTAADAAPPALDPAGYCCPSPSGLGSRLAGRPSGPRTLLGQERGASINSTRVAEATFHSLG
jgi:hypothetical protein